MHDAISAIGPAAARPMTHTAPIDVHIRSPLSGMPLATRAVDAAPAGSVGGVIDAVTQAATRMMTKADPRGEALYAEHQRLTDMPATLENYKRVAHVEVEMAQHIAAGMSALHLASSLSMSIMESFKSLLHTPN